MLNEDYDFERWLYYGYKYNIKDKKNIKPYELWEQMDRHLSEINFYETNENNNYSSSLKILKDYYTKERKYSYNRKNTHLTIDGFESFKMDDKVLNVSNLITIKEFKEFYNDSYKNTRSKKLDEIFTVNNDNEEYPVSVTWYDAIAYCRYIENKHNVPARLITLVEYENICPTSDKIYDTKDRLSFNYKNKEIDGIPSYMPDFDNVLMQYKKPLEYIENTSIQFPISATFFEWTNNFRSAHVEVTSERSLKLDSNFILSASSNNKYKYVKVGFRVCYELQKN